MAAYMHLHALGTPEWAENLVRVAADWKELHASQRTYREPAIRSGRRERKSDLRRRVEQLVRDKNLKELEAVVADHPRSVRHLVSMSYQTDKGIRETAARGLAMAARYHKNLIQSVVRRLIWAMNDESGTNAQTAPAVLLAIALEDPELLLPVLPDIVRLAGDSGLYDGLSKTLRVVQDSCPGKIGESLSRALNQRFSGGEPYGAGSAV